jgi:hypothetical protein
MLLPLFKVRNHTQFCADLGEQVRATQFIFTVPIQSGFQQLSPRDYEILFEAKKTSWTDALEKAYPETRSGKTKLIKDSVDTLLYRLFYEALIILNTDTEGLTGDYANFKKDFTANFRAASPRTPGKRPIPNRDERAKHLASRYKAVLPRMVDLRNFVNNLNQSGIDNESLLMRIGEVFKEDWIAFVTTGTAFGKLPPSEAQNVTGVATKWAPWKCTVAVICCEEEKRDPNTRFGFVTAYKLIVEGRKLILKDPSAAKE